MAAEEGGVRTLLNWLDAGNFSSSKSSRNGLRINSMLEAGSNLHPITEIPATVAQIISSIYALVCRDAHHSERFIHLILGLTTTVRLTLAITVLYMGDKCVDIDDADSLCTTSFLFQWIYVGVLLAAQGISEASKDAYTTPPAGDGDGPAGDEDDNNEDAVLGV